MSGASHKIAPDLRDGEPWCLTHDQPFNRCAQEIARMVESARGAVA